MNYDIYDNPPLEVIHGQVIAKANNYIAVPGKDGRHRIIKNERIRAYERTFAEQCRAYKDALIGTNFTLECTVYDRNNRFDLDNSIKTVLDCLQSAGAITDDCLCVHLDSYKKVDPYHPRVEYRIIADRPHPTLFDTEAD